jgi:hypothetical protein
MQVVFMENHAPEMCIDKAPAPFCPQSVQNSCSPSAGFTMALSPACVIFGRSTPLLLNLTSSPAEGCGWLPSVLMPTWALVLIQPINTNAIHNNLLNFFSLDFSANMDEKKGC